MVQSSRLKRKLHPLFPLLLILILSSLFLYFSYPTLKSKLENTFPKYETQRSTLIEQYNMNTGRIDTLLNADHGSISEYGKKLAEASELISKQQTILNEIAQLNLHTLQRTTNSNEYATLQSNMLEDSSRLSKESYVEDVVKEKIAAIDMYNIIKRFDKCIRTIKEKHNLLECRNIYSQISDPVTPSKNYIENSKILLNEYFDLSKSERVGIINTLVSEHNKMINSLEKIINKSISL